MLPEPDNSNLVELDDEEAPEPQSMMATYSNNQLRAMAANGYGLTKENWLEFTELNQDAVAAHRSYWGMDVSEGWKERAWNTPSDEIYDVVDEEQLEFAKNQPAIPEADSTKDAPEAATEDTPEAAATEDAAPEVASTTENVDGAE